MKKLLVLDVCDTLYPVNTTMGFLDYCVSSNSWKIFSLIRKTLFVKACNVVIYKLTKVDLMRAFSIRYLKGYSKFVLEKKAKDYIDTLDIIELVKIEIDKRKGEEWDVVLASASLDPIVSSICKKYMYSHYISSELLYDKKNICAGILKQDVLNEKHKYIENLSLKYNDITFITDNKGDANCISHVNEFIAVVPRRNNPDISFWENHQISKIIEL